MPCTLAGKRGYNCVLTAGEETVGKAQTVELEMTADEVDVTTRDSNGWREWLQGLKAASATVDQLWVPTNGGLLALLNAYMDGSVLEVSFEDEDGIGWSGCAIITGIRRPEPLDGAVGLNVTIRLTGPMTPVNIS